MHVHGPANRNTQRILRISLALTLGYILLTLIAGLRAHSLALISEAGHNASDFLALLLSFVAVYFESRPATGTKTFGYRRAGVLAAFVNGLSLIVIAVFIAVAALHRFQVPQAVQPKLMIAVAALGIAMNGAVAFLLTRASQDVNIRSTLIHMLGDALSTAAVVVGGFAILYLHQSWIDPLLSLLIAGLILWSSIGIVRETLHILLEGTPQGVDAEAIRISILQIEGVEDVHDLHVWSLGSNTHALATHVTISDIPPSASNEILRLINKGLRENFRIGHSTIQFEHVDCGIIEDCMKEAAALAETGGHSHSHAGHHH